MVNLKLFGNILVVSMTAITTTTSLLQSVVCLALPIGCLIISILIDPIKANEINAAFDGLSWQELQGNNVTINVKETHRQLYDDSIWCVSCYCGLPSKMNRIVGGWNTEVNEYPWMVALKLRDKKGRQKLFCGGTLINDLYVLTAAHCLRHLSPEKITIVIAEHNLATTDETLTLVRRVEKIIIHSKFEEQVRFNNDIALMKMNLRVAFRSSAKPACLPPEGMDLEDMEGHVIGWGATKEGGSSASELMETNVMVFGNRECHNFSGFSASHVTENMFCAGMLDGGHDSCQGDSGGPLLLTGRYGRLVVAGIVSWGDGCARPNRPGVYTRVNKYVRWIVDNTKDACYCY